jgi:hypothetical protein
VHNGGAWTVSLGPPCPQIDVLTSSMPPGLGHVCRGVSGPQPALASGASVSFPVRVYAQQFRECCLGAEHDFFAVSPGDYSVTIPYLSGVRIAVHVRDAVTVRLHTTHATVSAGAALDVRVDYSSDSDATVLYDEHIPPSCDSLPRPRPPYACQTTTAGQLPFPPHFHGQGFPVHVHSEGLAPGTYLLDIAGQAFTLTVT